MNRALVFGGSGQIGQACAQALAEAGHHVTTTSRAGVDGTTAYDPLEDADALPDGGAFDAVIWAQGANLNDSIRTFDRERHQQLYDANVMFVLLSLHALVAGERLAPGARLVIVSSVWQRVGRPDKLSYMVTKSALEGLVRSASLDLADAGILVNAVLPGALDTPMTRANLAPDQLERVAAMTPFGRLPAMADVAAMVAFLASPANTSITGQFVAVDLGFSHARLV